MVSYIKIYRIVLLACLLALPFAELNAQEQKQSKFLWGGGISIAISDYLDIDISPRVGYYITPNFITGLLAKYEYVNFKNEVEPYKSNTFGGGVFAQYNISSLFFNQSTPYGIYVQTEYHYLYTKVDWKRQSYSDYYTDDRWYVGGGISVPIGARACVYTTILYDILRVIKNEHNDYNKPVINVGILF